MVDFILARFANSAKGWISTPNIVPFGDLIFYPKGISILPF
jgi:hypothetical protein